MTTLSGSRSFVTIVSATAMLFAIATPAAAHHGNHSLKGKGTIQVSSPTTCGPNLCYSVNADFPPQGGSSISATATGEGMEDPTTCKNKSGKSCCVTAIGLTFTFDQGMTEVGTFDCVVAATDCVKPPTAPTSETLKGKLTCMDGTGELAGKTGKGKLSADPSPSTGMGTVSASIHIK
jgi:hypothetical protein